MTALKSCALAACLLSPLTAAAETAFDDKVFNGTLLVAVAAPSALFDALIAGSPEGRPHLALGIAALATGSVSLVFGALYSAFKAHDVALGTGWSWAGYGVAATGAMSMVVGVIGMVRALSPQPDPGSAPATSVSLAPQLGIGPSGAVTVGVAGTL